ncbi:Protein CBG13594 [Caenorhabditis briggsae]|uniref:Protein CBG13594 n=1 Tax=Caenorhabditis briggsae TaxID=6238 RepID=A8XI96_CAEBR|nr:Protein CBG13594 [Caenorhabditis briggsae]CAP32370.2 Protein CBG13594 [Caenorhabditis briggsae]
MLMALTNTQFQSIIIFLALSIVIGNSPPSGGLTAEENQKRLDSCGGDALPTPSRNTDGVSISTKTKIAWLTCAWINGMSLTTASIISSRHIITSSFLVIDGISWRWSISGEQVKFSDCMNGMDLEVPQRERQSIYLNQLPTIGVANIVRAFILGVCDPEKKTLVGPSPPFRLMVAELDQNLEEKVPCLADDTTEILHGSIFDTYGSALVPTYQGAKDVDITHRKLKLQLGKKSDNPDLMLTEAYHDNATFAAALTKIDNNKRSTIIGIGTQGIPRGKYQNTSSFFNIVHYQHRICDLVGICPKGTGNLTQAEDTVRAENCGRDKLNPSTQIESSLDSFDTVNMQFIDRKIWIENPEKHNHKLNQFLPYIIENSGTGGALVEITNGRTLLLGLGGSNSRKASDKEMFYNMIKLHDALCPMVGICKKVTTVIVPKTTTTTTTTTTPSLKPSATFQNSKANATTISDTPQPITFPTSAPTTAPEYSDLLEIPNRRPEIDVDEEYEEYLAQKKASEADYVDVDDDIVMLMALTNTQFQSIIIFLALSIVIGNSAPSGGLTVEENQKRLNSCGGDALPTPSVNRTGLPLPKQPTRLAWLTCLMHNNSQHRRHKQYSNPTTASIISSRHIITSSSLVIDVNWKWLKSNGQVKFSDCPNGMDLEVPEEELKSLFLNYLIKPASEKDQRVAKIVRAYILGICDPKKGSLVDPNPPFKPMVAELEQNLEENVPCLADAALTKIDNNKRSTIIGIGTQGIPRGKYQNTSSFFNIVHYQYRICALVGICPKGTGKLTPAEDSTRAENCGKDHLDPRVASSVLSQQWYGSLKYKGSNNVFPAIMISSRHLLASTEVFKDYEQFYQKWIDMQCSGGTYYNVVSNQLLSRLEMTIAQFKTPATFILRAYVLRYCGATSVDQKGHMSYPMILEVNQKYQGSPPCLWNDPAIQLEPSLVNYDTANMKFFYDDILLPNPEKYTHYIDVNTNRSGSGGALVQFTDGRKILLGIGGSNERKSPQTICFYSMVLLHDALCPMVGICKKLTTVIVPKTTTTTTTTTTPSLKPSATFQNPKANATTISDTPQPITFPTSAPTTAPEYSDLVEIPNRRPEIDVDEEYEEYLAQKKASEADYVDVDDDIVVSRDFFTDRGKEGKVELSILSLISVILLFQ